VKLKMQVVFKSGGSLQGETEVKNYEEFLQRVNQGSDEKLFFQILDVEKEKNHCIMLKMEEVNALVLEEIDDHPGEEAS